MGEGRHTRILPLGIVGVGLESVCAPGGVFEAEVRGCKGRDGRCEEESCGNHFVGVVAID